MERDVPAIVTDLTGLVVPDRYHTLLTVIVLMIAIYGISKTIERLFPTRKTDKLDENFRSLTVVAGDLIQTPPAQIEATIKGRLADKKQGQLSSAIRSFFAPAAGKEGDAIVGGGTLITADALKQIPNLAAPEPESPTDIIDT